MQILRSQCFRGLTSFAKVKPIWRNGEKISKNQPKLENFREAKLSLNQNLKPAKSCNCWA
jgi:hypothetical protein